MKKNFWETFTFSDLVFVIGLILVSLGHFGGLLLCALIMFNDYE